MLTTSIRSKGLIYETKGKDGNEIIEEIKGENLCRYGENLYTKNKSIMLID